MKRLILIVLLGSLAAPAALAHDGYPTAARVQYVLDCMATNGNDLATLQKCSCSIDFVAQKLALSQYDQIETIFRMRKVPGENTAMFRDVPWIKQAVAEFDDIQTEARLACFGM